jgi:hypothetical protein
MEIDLENKPIKIFLTYSSYTNQLNSYPTQILNPTLININNIKSQIIDYKSSSNINKRIILKKGSIIEFYVMNGGSLYDYLPREIFVYSSASECFDINGKRNNVCGMLTHYQNTNPNNLILGGASCYVYTSVFEPRGKFVSLYDIDLGTTCDNLYLGFLIKPCISFKIPPLTGRSTVDNFLGDLYKDGYYWLNTKFGIKFPKTGGDSVQYDECSEIKCNILLDVI